jgi:serine protease Do
LKIFRDGKTLDVPVTIGELPTDKSAQLASLGGGSAKPRGNALGIAVEEISTDDRKELGLKDQNGVMIAQAGPVAQRGGLQRGDIVLKVGRSYVKNSAEFQNAVKEVKPGDSVMLLVRRGDAAQFVTLTVPKAKNG